MKIIKWAVLAVVLLVLIGLGVFWFTLDRIVRGTVETQATASLQTPTTLGGASVSPFVEPCARMSSHLSRTRRHETQTPARLADRDCSRNSPRD